MADRLIRMVIEEGLNQLPYQDCVVTTPTGCTYSGHKFEKGNCGVSIVRSGEAMEKALQECCRSMRIGKVLVDSDSETHEAHVVFAKFPDDIATRKVLLLYPIMRLDEVSLVTIPPIYLYPLDLVTKCVKQSRC